MNNKWFEKIKRNMTDEEDAIMSCWNITEEIKFLYVQIMDGPEITDDEICNILLGLQQQYDRKFQELFETFEATHSPNSIIHGYDINKTKGNT